MKFFLNKLSTPESEFMQIFKKTKIFSEYNEFYEYQNDSGKRVIENIRIKRSKKKFC